jgi:hypothetical protein
VSIGAVVAVLRHPKWGVTAAQGSTSVTILTTNLAALARRAAQQPVTSIELQAVSTADIRAKGRIESGSSGLSMFALGTHDLTIRPVDHGMAVGSHADRDDLVNPQQSSLGKIGWLHSPSQGAIPVFFSR